MVNGETTKFGSRVYLSVKEFMTPLKRFLKSRFYSSIYHILSDIFTLVSFFFFFDMYLT